MSPPSLTERSVLRIALRSHQMGCALIVDEPPSQVMLENLRTKGWLQRRRDGDGDDLYTITLQGIVAATGPAAPPN